MVDESKLVPGAVVRLKPVTISKSLTAVTVESVQFTTENGASGCWVFPGDIEEIISVPAGDWPPFTRGRRDGLEFEYIDHRRGHAIIWVTADHNTRALRFEPHYQSVSLAWVEGAEPVE